MLAALANEGRYDKNGYRKGLCPPRAALSERKRKGEALAKTSSLVLPSSFISSLFNLLESLLIFHADPDR
jgi:hypothetical protein